MKNVHRTVFWRYELSVQIYPVCDLHFSSGKKECLSTLELYYHAKYHFLVILPFNVSHHVDGFEKEK